MSIKKRAVALITMCAVTTGFLGAIEDVKIVKAAETVVKEESHSNNDEIGYTIENYDDFEVKIYDKFVVIKKYTGKDSEVTIPEKINEIPVMEIGEEAFKENKKIEKVVIPSSVTTIKKSAFNGCTSLKTVEFSKGLLSIESLAFSSCKLLENLDLPNTLKEIDEFAFSECSSIKSINIPDSVVEIGESAFNWCENLEEINVSENNENYSSENKILYSKYKSILMCCPAGLKEKEVQINNDTTTIYDYAFNGCKNIEKILIPEGVKSIGNNGFSSCTNLTDISIPNTVEYLGYSAFYNCINLKNVKLSSELNEIEPASFEQCVSLESLEIPKSVEKISVGAFENCTSLNTIVVPKSVIQIQAAFEGLYNLVIFGEQDSYIAKYCKEMNIKFIPFSNSSDTLQEETNKEVALNKEEKQLEVKKIENKVEEKNENSNEINSHKKEDTKKNENETNISIKTKSVKKTSSSSSNFEKSIKTGDNKSIMKTIFVMMSSLITLCATSRKRK
ncbi:MAG: leucine-rich repeat domain-containing protein [Clostridium sp.]